jgi:dephospho-CoA kinase
MEDCLLRVGLTGGVACGKSTVARMFAQRGAYLIQADQIGHGLLMPGQDVYSKVVERFGTGILNEDNTISHPKLAEAAFGGGRIQELNAIVHPAVVARQDAWVEDVFKRNPKAVAMVEAALILEAGVATKFEKLIVVACRLDQKVERFAQRLRTDLETARNEVSRRMAVQLSEQEKISRADYVIDNSGSLADTESQVDRVWMELKRLAEMKK